MSLSQLQRTLESLTWAYPGIALLFACGVAMTPVGAQGQVTVSSVALSDTSFGVGGAETTSIDVVQDLNCNKDEATTTDIEPFHDTFASIKVFNSSSRAVRFSRFWYRVRTGAGYFTSKKRAVIGNSYVAPNKDGSFYGILTHAKSGSKYFVGSRSAISSSLGVRNVTIYVSGSDGTGRSYLLRTTTVASFSDYDRCG